MSSYLYLSLIGFPDYFDHQQSSLDKHFMDDIIIIKFL
jgi:hypothetical protein